jgi:hypothetical protein
VHTFLKQKNNTIGTITRCGSTDSCRDLFKNLKILYLQSQYILSLLLFLVNKNKFLSNSDVTTHILDQNITSTNLNQICHSMKKECTQLAQNSLTVPHKAPETYGNRCGSRNVVRKFTLHTVQKPKNQSYNPNNLN